MVVVVKDKVVESEAASEHLDHAPRRAWQARDVPVTDLVVEVVEPERQPR